MGPELSVIIVTLRDEIRPIQYFEACAFNDFEIIIRRDSGIAEARNKGVREASSDKILFIDDDARPCASYLKNASGLLNQHPAITGRVIQPLDALSSNWEVEVYDQGDEPKKTDVLIGCNMGFQRQTLEAVGGFDERFDFGNEETELAKRINKESYIHYDPELSVEHAFAESRRQYWCKSFHKGKSDVKWCEKEGIEKVEQAKHFIYFPGRDPTRFIGYLTRSVGRISEWLT